MMLPSSWHDLRSRRSCSFLAWSSEKRICAMKKTQVYAGLGGLEGYRQTLSVCDCIDHRITFGE